NGAGRAACGSAGAPACGLHAEHGRDRVIAAPTLPTQLPACRVRTRSWWARRPRSDRDKATLWG
ncbi:hypothetical protein ACPXCX_56705, partial [Streptomyces sp. DT225]